MQKFILVLCGATLWTAPCACAAITAISFTRSPAAQVGAGESRTIFQGEPDMGCSQKREKIAR